MEQLKHHQEASSSSKQTTYFSLKTRKQIHKERMSHRVCNFKDPLLAEQRFDFIASNNVALLECLNGKVFARVAVL